MYLPAVIPEVAFALIALWIFNPIYGPLNLVLRGVGLPAPDWLNNPDTAKLVFVIMSLFQIGEAFVILLIGLQDVPPEVITAAAVDGSTPWQSFRYITLPLLLPWIALITFRAVIVGFQWTFTPALIMTGGDPYYATLFMPLLIYEEAFDRFRFGPGAAMMLIVVLMTLYFISTLYILFKSGGYADESRVTYAGPRNLRSAPRPADHDRRVVRDADRVDDRRFAAPARFASAPIDRADPQPDRTRQLRARLRSAAVGPLLRQLADRRQRRRAHHDRRRFVGGVRHGAAARSITPHPAGLLAGLLLIPFSALWLTRFVLFSSIGLINSHAALIAPALAGTSPLFVLLFYWTFRRVPLELFESARLEGAHAFSIWWRIALPIALPTAAAVGMLAFCFTGAISCRRCCI